MNLEINGHNVLWIITLTFLVSVLLVPIVKKIANHVGAIDKPDKRKVHTKPTPRMGGLAIFLSFVFGYILFAESNYQMMSILIGGFILILLGIFDDINPIKARYKLLVQLIAASIVVFYGNIYLHEISAFGLYIHFGAFGFPLAVLFITAIINAINLIDGLDGLAAGISSIYFLTISIIALILNRLGGFDSTLALIMLGATLGFLVHNFPPATIFMGDTGSMFLGYIISIISLLGYKAMTVTSLFVPIMIIFLPIIDTLLAILRRLLKGCNVGEPDKEHIHHQFLKLNKSTRKTVLIMYSISLLCAVISIFYTLGNNNVAIVLYLMLMIIIAFLILKTDILFKKNK